MLEKSFRNKSERHSFLLQYWQGRTSSSNRAFLTNILQEKSSTDKDIVYSDDDDDVYCVKSLPNPLVLVWL